MISYAPVLTSGKKCSSCKHHLVADISFECTFCRVSFCQQCAVHHEPSHGSAIVCTFPAQSVDSEQCTTCQKKCLYSYRCQTCSFSNCLDCWTDNGINRHEHSIFRLIEPVSTSINEACCDGPSFNHCESCQQPFQYQQSVSLCATCYVEHGQLVYRCTDCSGHNKDHSSWTWSLISCEENQQRVQCNSCDFAVRDIDGIVQHEHASFTQYLAVAGVEDVIMRSHRQCKNKSWRHDELVEGDKKCSGCHHAFPLTSTCSECPFELCGWCVDTVGKFHRHPMDRSVNASQSVQGSTSRDTPSVDEQAPTPEMRRQSRKPVPGQDNMVQQPNLNVPQQNVQVQQREGIVQQDMNQPLVQVPSNSGSSQGNFSPPTVSSETFPAPQSYFPPPPSRTPSSVPSISGSYGGLSPLSATSSATTPSTVGSPYGNFPPPPPRPSNAPGTLPTATLPTKSTDKYSFNTAAATEKIKGMMTKENLRRAAKVGLFTTAVLGGADANQTYNNLKKWDTNGLNWSGKPAAGTQTAEQMAQQNVNLQQPAPIAQQNSQQYGNSQQQSVMNAAPVAQQSGQQYGNSQQQPVMNPALMAQQNGQMSWNSPQQTVPANLQQTQQSAQWNMPQQTAVMNSTQQLQQNAQMWNPAQQTTSPGQTSWNPQQATPVMNPVQPQQATPVMNPAQPQQATPAVNPVQPQNAQMDWNLPQGAAGQTIQQNPQMTWNSTG